MQDDKNAAENEDIDDLDFDDLDAEEDFGDESWDDFDDSDPEIEDVDSPESAAPAKTGNGNKTFLQKNFNLIVIAIATVGGGGFILSQFGGAPSTTQTGGEPVYQASADMADAADQELPSLAGNDGSAVQPLDIPDLEGGFPPMPAPIESVGEDQVALTSNEIPDLDVQEETETPIADAGVLTPLPDLTDASEDTTLGDLDLPLEGLNFELESSLQEQIVDEDVQLSAAEPEPVALQQEQAADTLIDAEPIESPVIDEVPSIVEDATAKAPPEQETAVDSAALENQILALQSTLSENEGALQKASAAEEKLTAELEFANNQIGSLKSELEALKASVSAKKADTSSSPAQKTQTSEAPSKPAVPKPEVKKTPPKAVKEKTEQWVMRSAQPGAATLYSKDSGDLRRVEMGDTIGGLGKIQSISIENGRWVVRGSKGSISQ